jgi:branched-chain amino acid transport system ATP-binding protein
MCTRGRCDDETTTSTPTTTAQSAPGVFEGSGLEVRDLRVFYGPVPAVRGVSLECRPGRIVGVIGPNGAGKTSLLTGIAGLVKTSGGSLHLDGRDISRWPAHRRGQAGITMVAERRRIFPSLSVRENLTVGGWGLDKAEVNARVERIFTMFPRLKEREKVPSFRLSGGEQRMLSIGRALVTGARCILFDELSLGLAPRIVRGHRDGARPGRGGAHRRARRAVHRRAPHAGRLDPRAGAWAGQVRRPHAGGGTVAGGERLHGPREGRDGQD